MNPFRVQPPEVDLDLHRSELQRMLLDRFDRRVTVVSAGAGYGKTTALAVAVAQNRLSRRGIDLWLTCESDDKDTGNLLAGLAQAIGHDQTSTADIVAWTASQSPAQVCLVLDDAHKIPAGSDGAHLVTELVDSLPLNGHVLMATRGAPSIPLARLDAQDRVRWVGSGDLKLRESEVARLAERAGVPLDDLSRFDGWPALVALAMRSRGVQDFLHEEVLAWLSTDQRSALEAAVAIGSVDAVILSHLVGVSPGVLGALPLIHNVDGWYVPHDLWVEAVGALVEPDSLNELRHRGVVHLLDMGEATRAVEACLRGHDTDLLQVAMRAAITHPTANLTSAARQWLNRIPRDAIDTPLLDYLTGLVLQHDDPTSSQTRAQFSRAADAFGQQGHVDAEVMALVQLGYWCHLHRDINGLLSVATRMGELASNGIEMALPYSIISEAFVALVGGRPELVLDALHRVGPGEVTPAFAATVDWLRAQALELLGYSSVAAADACVSHGVPTAGYAVLALSSRWRNGDIEALAGGWQFHDEPANDRDDFLRCIWTGITSAAFGKLEEARRHLDEARRLGGTAEQVDISIGLLEAAIAGESGDQGKRREIAVELMQRCPPRDANRISYNGAAGMIARELPQWIPYFESPEMGPIRRRDLDIARALRRLDEGSLDGVAQLTWPDTHGGLISSAMLSGATEVTCAAWAVGRREAKEAAAWMVRVVGEPSRAMFRRMTNHAIPAVASAAAEIVAGIPVPPVHQVKIEVLGPVRLTIDGSLITDSNWRRERVRSLLGFLLLNQTTTRGAAIAALWPDADEASGRRSLRSTLNLLHGVLEPSRVAGEAPYFVRSDGRSLELCSGGHLTVDAHCFEKLLDESEQHERSGLTAESLVSLQQACAIYRGDLLPDSLYDDWTAMERDRLRSRFVRASIRLGELLLAYDRVDEALAVAGRALEMEPWSEAAHRVVVASHLELGDRPGAQRALKRCKQALDEIGGPVEELTFMLQRRLELP